MTKQMNYLALTAEERQEMMEAIGVEQFTQILQAIPPSLKNPHMNIPEGISEIEVGKLCYQLSSQNSHCKNRLSFLGAGAYEHFIPAVVNAIISRGEFYTAYTPYQAEASQGTLQAMFEYQSLICGLTGMDVSNSSHYDGATSLAEAVLLSLVKTKRKKILIASSVHPEFRQVVRSYINWEDITVVEIPFLSDGRLNREKLKQELSPEVASVVVASPNFFGAIEDFEGLANEVHQNGALLIQAVNPLSLGFYKTPGEWGADIACGEGQPLGIPMSFGGPWLGFFATKRDHLRQIPGRLVGITKDADGRRAFCLTLQAREQHIRRERASSNICSNEALCALAACVYMAAVGKRGIQRIAELNIENANYLRSEISKLKGFRVMTTGPIFNEFTIACPVSAAVLNARLLDEGIIGGFDVEQFYPEMKNTILFCVTETKTKEDMGRLITALKQGAS